jgi:hypothetical protein
MAMTLKPGQTYDLCSQKANRAEFAAHMVEMAEKNGAVATVEIDEKYRETRVEIAIGHYRVSMYFEGDTKIGVFMGHWYTSIPLGETLPLYPATFVRVIGEKGRAEETHKATTITATFDHFYALIQRGLRHLRPIVEVPALAEAA